MANVIQESRTLTRLGDRTLHCLFLPLPSLNMKSDLIRISKRIKDSVEVLWENCSSLKEKEVSWLETEEGLQFITFLNCIIPSDSLLLLPVCLPGSLGCLCWWLEEMARCARKRKQSVHLRDTFDCAIPMCYRIIAQYPRSD